MPGLASWPIVLLGLRKVMSLVAMVWGRKVESHGERRSIQSDRERGRRGGERDRSEDMETKELRRK